MYSFVSKNNRTASDDRDAVSLFHSAHFLIDKARVITRKIEIGEKIIQNDGG